MLTTSRARDAIDTMLVEGRKFDQIEDFIACQPVSEEEQSALWLWAWAEQPWALRRLAPSAGGDKFPLGRG
jgi:hypothetical protein